MRWDELRVKRKTFFSEIGLNPDDITPWSKKWKGLKQTSLKRGSEFNLSFEDYVKIAVESGLNHHNQIGRTKGKHGMARIGDTGPYEVGNCRFLPTEENIAERTLNGGTASQARKMSKKFECVSPDGEIHIGENISKFERDNGFCNSSLSSVALGKYNSYFGWTCKYLVKEV